jgi:hypothetical protein
MGEVSGERKLVIRCDDDDNDDDDDDDNRIEDGQWTEETSHYTSSILT